ncbi:hypothetical protein P3T76_009181 [Phytophthora citrophthora]|uniref:Uncharacterized protein n=1 Tax=Phytophthora citrophthora TaxID=4793 RepID=A0AAD9LJ01_9STRA|nr:hypothetical protein P3T76_009181 [Phytophthora citrophthora]
MDGSFIPPPFPFPEAWPRVFAEQQHQQERRWLTPTTIGAVQWSVSVATEHYYPTDPIPATDVQVEDDDEKSSEYEYEYGYVLSDEWRKRFQSSIQLQQQQLQQDQPNTRSNKKRHKKKMKQQQKKTANTEAVAAASASRSGHLQREIQAAKTRELARKWKRRDGSNAIALGSRVTALETSLNAQFDEFCDVFQPVGEVFIQRLGLCMREVEAAIMNLGQLKNDPANGSAQAIPSLKRTLSGGAAGSVGHGPAGGLASHLGMNNINSIPSVLHATPNTNPPQMLRAVTASGVYNRPSSNQAFRGGNSGLSTGAAGGSGGAGANTNVSATTATRSVSQSSTMQDWRMYLTIEERQAVRSKIRDAYTSRCSTYEDLLQVACAIEEELLHISAPSRLDYFKSGFEFENRVKLKKDQLQGQLAALDAKRRSSSIGQQQQQQGTPGGSSSGSKAVGSSKKQRN